MVIAPLIVLSLNKTIVEENNLLVVKGIPWVDPIIAFDQFNREPWSFLLHGNGKENFSRWSYIAQSPFASVEVDSELRTFVNGIRSNDDPFSIIRSICTTNYNKIKRSPVPFYGGAVGFIGYEANQLIEVVPKPKEPDSNPLLCVGFYDLIIAFDRNNKKTFLVSSGLPETSLVERFDYATKRIDYFYQKINKIIPREIKTYKGTWKPEVSRQSAQNKIREAIDYIYSGDIFQVNITHKFKSPRPPDLDAWELFRKLRATNPSPFGAYLSINKNFKILSCSPERFIKLDSNKNVETRPIKGSQRRDIDQEKDAILANQLLKSGKNFSENLMIVDLMRNDLSKVCEVGSIKVDDLCKLESFEKIHHLVSVITGKLRKDKDAVHLLRLCFPGGSVTGAPKIRAMEIINELETSSRGPYCGSIFWMGFDDQFDSSITIRSIVVSEDEIIAQAGGAIVAESDPYEEYEEALFKASPLLNILEER